MADPTGDTVLHVKASTSSKWPPAKCEEGIPVNIANEDYRAVQRVEKNLFNLPNDVKVEGKVLQYESKEEAKLNEKH